MRRLRAVGWITVILMLLAACGTPEDPSAEVDDTPDDAAGDVAAEDTEEEEPDDAAGDGDGEPIRIGISLPLTGDFSNPGQGIQEGYELWAEDVNEQGGLLGRPVELVFRDDGSDPNTAVSDYEQLITQENVDLVFGPFSSRLVIPASEVVESYNMLFLEPAGASAEVFERGLEYLFYTAPAVADDHYNLLAEWILNLPEDERPTTAAYAAMDDPFAQGTAYGLRDKLAEAGVETVTDEVYPPEQTDFSAIAARVADTDAEVFVGGTQFEDSVGLIRAFQELGYQPQIAAFSTGPTEPEFPEAIGGGTDGIFSPIGYSPAADVPTNQEFVDSHREMFDAEPGEDQANGYTVGQVAAAAIEAVGCADPSEECQTQLRDHVRDNEFDTVVGPLSFDEAGRPEGAHMILQWIDGNPEIVMAEDESALTAELIHPKPEW